MPSRLAACLLTAAALLTPAVPAVALEPICVDVREVYVRDITYDPPMICVL